MPCSFRIVWMVVRPISCPSVRSRSLRRVYPQQRVLDCERHNHGSDLIASAWTTKSAAIARAVILLGYELPIPAQDRLGCDDAVQLS